MAIVILLLGLLVSGVSIFAVIRPHVYLKLAASIKMSAALRVASGLARIGIGAVLFTIAAQTAYPMTARVVGLIFVLLGALVLLIPTRVLQSVVSRVLEFLTPLRIRIGGVVGAVLGLLLAYLVVGGI